MNEMKYNLWNLCPSVKYLPIKDPYSIFRITILYQKDFFRMQEKLFSRACFKEILHSRLLYVYTHKIIISESNFKSINQF